MYQPENNYKSLFELKVANYHKLEFLKNLELKYLYFIRSFKEIGDQNDQGFLARTGHIKIDATNNEEINTIKREQTKSFSIKKNSIECSCFFRASLPEI